MFVPWQHRHLDALQKVIDELNKTQGHCQTTVGGLNM